jgi:cystathionine beta-lyase family protein involved in aluminum resistance
MRMDISLEELLKNGFNICENVIEASSKAEKSISKVLEGINSTSRFNQLKVIKAMQNNKLSDSHFSGTTGYGYDDRGREVLDNVYAEIFKAEDALVRHQIVAGTHALAICMYGNLRPGDELLSITGKPYDTLEEIIGIRGQNCGSLKEFGISYKQLELLENGDIDLERLSESINSRTKMVFIQRSRGYNWRRSLRINDIENAIVCIRKIKDDVIVLVDNCYGEFVEKREPLEAGADLIAGSLIKNPGGGLAPTGGYIAGKEKYVGNAAYRLTTPGLGKNVGASLNNNRLFFQGLFIAPHVVGECLKGAVFCASLMEGFGFETSPQAFEQRGDIIQAVKFREKEELILFCQGIQKGSPVDSFVTPEPWEMPGYDCPVIMAAGAFVQGSSIELSADAPIRPPFTAYLQGGLVYEHAKLGVMIAADNLIKAGFLNGLNGGKK